MPVDLPDPAPEGLSPEELRTWNITELKKAVGHLIKRNEAREWLLADIEKTRPNPVEVQAARLEFIVAALVPDELQRLWLEHAWQQNYAGILGQIEDEVKTAPKNDR